MKPGAAAPLDALIVGGGPAGLAAGLHLARAGYRSLLAERARFGGQAAEIERIENYPGFPGGAGGQALMGAWLRQARGWGLRTALDEAEAVSRRGPLFTVRLRERGAVRARALLWCAGAAFRRLGVPGEERFLGRGVWHTAWAAPRRAGRASAVVGSGEAAVQQAVFLAGRGERVTLVSRGPGLKAHRLLLGRLAESGARHLPGYTTARITGSARPEALELLPAGGGRALRLEAEAVFVLAGKVPRPVPAAWRRAPAGLFIAGDAAGGIYRQVAVAGGDGIRAAMDCITYLEGGWPN